VVLLNTQLSLISLNLGKMCLMSLNFLYIKIGFNFYILKMIILFLYVLSVNYDNNLNVH